MARPISKKEANRQTFEGVMIFLTFMFAIGYSIYYSIDALIKSIF